MNQSSISIPRHLETVASQRKSLRIKLIVNPSIQVGPEFPLALDCYMSLSVPYAIKLGKALQPYGIKWIEEVLPPVRTHLSHVMRIDVMIILA